jgi:hypothetical protein
VNEQLPLSSCAGLVRIAEAIVEIVHEYRAYTKSEGGKPGRSYVPLVSDASITSKANRAVPT